MSDPIHHILDAEKLKPHKKGLGWLEVTLRSYETKKINHLIAEEIKRRNRKFNAKWECSKPRVEYEYLDGLIVDVLENNGYEDWVEEGFRRGDEKTKDKKAIKIIKHPKKTI